MKMGSYKNLIIFLVILPFIYCKTVENEKEHDVTFKNDDINVNGKWQNVGKDDLHDFKDEEPSQLFADFRESHITKDTANKLRQRTKKHKKAYLIRDNDDGSQDFKSKKIIYDKKYFDYLPAEQTESSPENKQQENLSKRMNSRRFRRNAERKEKIRHKRNAGFYYQTYVQQPAQQHYQMQYQRPSYQAQASNNNPWSNNFYNVPQKPVVNVPFAGYSYPIPSFQMFYPSRPQIPYRNPGSPPQNPDRFYLPAAKPDITNRFSSDNDAIFFPTDDDNEFQFNVYDTPNRRPQGGSSQIPTTTRRTTAAPLTTRRPPSLAHNSDYEDFDWDSLPSLPAPSNSVNAPRPTTTTTTTTRRPQTTRAPQTTRGPQSTQRPPSLAHNSDYEDFDWDSLLVAQKNGRSKRQTRRDYWAIVTEAPSQNQQPTVNYDATLAGSEYMSTDASIINRASGNQMSDLTTSKPLSIAHLSDYEDFDWDSLPGLVKPLPKDDLNENVELDENLPPVMSTTDRPLSMKEKLNAAKSEECIRSIVFCCQTPLYSCFEHYQCTFLFQDRDKICSEAIFMLALTKYNTFRNA